MREKRAVVYPASLVGSLAARADMESASPLRQSIQAASIRLPEGLSASNSVGASRCAMMGDQSLRKGGWVKDQDACSSRHCIGSAFHLFLHACDDAVIRLAIAQRRVENARQFVGQRTGGFVMVAACLERQRPLSQAVKVLAGRMWHGSGAQYRAGPMREQHTQVAVAAFGNAPQGTRAARRVFLGVSPNQLAK
jgi:hypothetical protein